MGTSIPISGGHTFDLILKCETASIVQDSFTVLHNVNIVQH